jgi:hypothetical protein
MESGLAMLLSVILACGSFIATGIHDYSKKHTDKYHHDNNK